MERRRRRAQDGDFLWCSLQRDRGAGVRKRELERASQKERDTEAEREAERLARLLL